jgi:hypothetical protein
VVNPTDSEDWRVQPPGPRVRHALLLHRGEPSCVEGLRAVLRRRSAADAVLAVVTPETHRVIAPTLGPLAAYEDVSELGRNPARVIPAIRRFVESQRRRRRVVVVTEQWWHQRDLAERVELARHEAICNLAFGGNDVLLVCLYDTRHMSTGIVADAKRTHPLVVGENGLRPNPGFVDPETMLEMATTPLDPVPFGAESFEVKPGGLAALRAAVERRGHTAGLTSQRVEDLVLAANELATNVVRHGQGEGCLQMWTDGPWLICEVANRDGLADPFIGTRSPASDETTGRGLWIVNQLCDLVELRTSPSGTAVRLRFARPASLTSAVPPHWA